MHPRKFLSGLPAVDAEKVASDDVLKGHGFRGCGKTLFTRCFERHGFSRAEQVLSLCHSERALAREESAFLTFSEAFSVAP